MAKLGKFSGGLVLAGHKQSGDIVESTTPAELVYPLLQRSNSYVQPIVHLGESVLKGQVIATASHPFTTPVHAASSGVIKAIAPLPIAHPSGLSDTCIIIATDGLDNAIAANPCVNLHSETPELLRAKIHQAGIVGLGGATFPTAKKLHTVKPIHTLIINGAECEPYISCDASLIEAHAQQLIQGALIMQRILQAERCIIALENNMPAARQALAETLQQEDIQLVTVPAIYPTGGEKQLIQVLTGSNIPTQSLPAEHGFFCQNIATVYAIYQAIYLGMPLTERIITLTGAGIKHTKNIRAKIGTPIKHLIEQCGGYNQGVQRLIMGGSMMGIALNTDDIAVTKATNCILAMAGDDLVKKPVAMPCIRCGDCANVCPVELLPQELYRHSRSKQRLQSLDYRLLDCIECGCCDVVCPSHIPLVQVFRGAKGEHIIKQEQAAQASQAKLRFQNRQQRFTQMEQEKKQKANKRQAMIEKMKAAAKSK